MSELASTKGDVSHRRTLTIAMLAAAEYDVDARIRRQAEGLVARGDSVTVYCISRSGQRAGRCLNGVAVVELPVSKYRGESVWRYVSAWGKFWLLAFAQLTRRPRTYDLIQVHSMPEVLVFATIVPRLLGVPVLLDIHDLTSHVFRSKFPANGYRALHILERWSIAFASGVITVHARYADVISSEYKIARTSIAVVMNSPDTKRFSMYRWRPWRGDDVTFSFHGTLVHRYGVLHMLEAFAKVQQKLPAARLEIRGDGDARQDIARHIAALGLQDSVWISAGSVSVDEMPHEIDGTNIGLAPNLLDVFTAEILPTKVLEYAALGIPVIASRLPLLTQYFDDRAICFVEPGDVNELADAMLRLACDPELAHAFARAARQNLVAIEWPGQLRTYLQLIDTIAAGR